jgi:hypothetical protein
MEYLFTFGRRGFMTCVFAGQRGAAPFMLLPPAASGPDVRGWCWLRFAPVQLSRFLGFLLHFWLDDACVWAFAS